MMKSEELKQFYNIIIATLDYDIIKHDNDKYKNNEFDFLGHFKDLKIKTKVIYEKGQLTKLKKWYHDIIEPYLNDPEFSSYIKDKTGYYVVPYNELQKRVNKTLSKGKIKGEKEYRDVMEMISQLIVKGDEEKINILQGLIDKFDRNFGKK